MLMSERQVMLHLCEKDNVQGLREGFEQFCKVLVEPEADTENPDDQNINRI